jgi:hypothetical protein
MAARGGNVPVSFFRTFFVHAYILFPGNCKNIDVTEITIGDAGRDA